MAHRGKKSMTWISHSALLLEVNMAEVYSADQKFEYDFKMNFSFKKWIYFVLNS